MSWLMLSFRVGMPGASRFFGSTPAGIAGVVPKLVSLKPLSLLPMKRWLYSTPTDQPSANIQSRPVPTTPPNLTAEALSVADRDLFVRVSEKLSAPSYLLSVTAAPPFTYQSSGPNE